MGLTSYTVIAGLADLDKTGFVDALNKTDTIAYDIETWGLDWFTHPIRLAQYELNGKIFILDLDTPSDERDQLFQRVTELIRDSGKTILSHNVKFELKFTLKNTGILLTNVYDTQLAETVVFAGLPGSMYTTLNILTQHYCLITLDKTITMKFTTDEIITDEMLWYSAMDVQYLKTIRNFQVGEAVNKGLLHVLDLEMALLPVVAKMEYDGVKLDIDTWLIHYRANIERAEFLFISIRERIFDKTSEYILNRCKNGIEALQAYSMPIQPATKKRRKYLEELTDKKFMLEEIKSLWKIGSNPQIRCALNLYGFPLESTGKLALQKYTSDQLIKDLMEYRECAKRASSFGEAWEKYINPVTGRVHPQFNQMGTATGRWSSSSPNMQNIVAKNEYRNCFIARPGYKIVTADYSQAELRLMAAVSGEMKMIEAYMNGEDIHAKTASILFQKPIEEITEEERGKGKTINFAIIYGASAYRIATSNDNITKQEAQHFLDMFFAGYPQLARFLQAIGKGIWERKYSRTPFGRARYFEDRTYFAQENDYYKFIARVKREGVNHITQGGSADALKIAMVDVFYNLPFDHDDFRFLIQVHDEVVVEVKEDIIDEAIPYLVGCMERGEAQFLKGIPAIVDYKVLDFWSK